jgi:hypothetical protein
MNEIKGQRLYVNLGASQVRKRLRGFGHGVRKIQSAGRNQAVIIHTASGEHLRELQALLADVLAPAAGEVEDASHHEPWEDQWAGADDVQVDVPARRQPPEDA